ncbi:hypothetical protein [Kocuria flava]|uniref:hypothetical protein n=1 Tax=Kocuria flava TaxID=446860 RepID=UPI002F93FA6D
MPYVGGVGAYRAKCDEVAAKQYEGFSLVWHRSAERRAPVRVGAGALRACVLRSRVPVGASSAA